MHIQIDTDHLGSKDLSVLEAVVTALKGGDNGFTVVKQGTPASAPKTAKPEPTPEPTPEPEPEPTPEPDLIGGGETYTMKDAVDLATKIVSQGEASRVREVLDGLGVKKVSELKGDQITTFVDTLS